MMRAMRGLLLLFLVSVVFICCHSKKAPDGSKPEWAKKDIRDYSDADMERLLDQWEEDDEPLEDDELPEHLRPQPKIDLSQLDMSDPEKMLKMTKKGKTLMAFVNVDPSYPREKTEEVTQLWQSSLRNNHIQAERYLIGDNRAIFMFKDGSVAWEAKDFLVEQEGCQEVVIENKKYPGLKLNLKMKREEL
ncbi:LDLR chaperone boca [Cloeon dipterum]|uniref:LDLR chaperone boca n=1 Tax=Cloeon dipterum TaxID=197152 RepID=UPI0032208454